MLSRGTKYFIKCLQYLLVPLIWPYSMLLGLVKGKKIVPRSSNDLLYYSAKNLARKIRNQQVKSEEVVETYIRRIKEVNPIINSVVDDRFVEALKDARLVDEMIKTSREEPEYWEKSKPLLGVPVTVKESIAVAGLSNNGGVPVDKNSHRMAGKDAVAVARLRDAGGIPLLVSNTPELCLFFESFNSVHGITANPYDTRRTAGGSSGGECALISSAASVIGIGSDIIGSGRIPALFCGVFGHKPTPRHISTEGHMPTSEDLEWDTFLTLSPICRYAEDLPLLMSAVAPDSSVNLRLNEPVDVKKLRVFYMEEDESVLTHRVDNAVKEAVRKAVVHFAKICEFHPRGVSFKEFDNALEAVCALMLRMKCPQNIFQKSENTEDWSCNDVLRMLVKRLFWMSNHTMHAISFGVIKKIAELMSEKRVKEIRDFKTDWQNKFKDLLGEDGVFILPTFPHLANFHYQQYYKLTSSTYMSTFNLLEMPSTACPMGLTESGLPVGIQVAAWKNQDRLTFAVARELEYVFGGWISPGCDRRMSSP